MTPDDGPDYPPPEDYDLWAGTPAPDGTIPDAEPEPEPLPVEGLIPLGHNRGVFFYYSLAGRQIRALQDSQHSANTLKAIASQAHYWERTQFFNAKGGNIRWDDAIDWLMTECKRIGIFDPAKIRGRGAWIDDGRAVLHVGDCLIVDGKRSSLSLPRTKYVYEAAIRLGEFREPPLSTREANRLYTICQRLKWERGISGTLMAGFLAVAPVCGGLSWRPSCWLTGASGSGKSWINEHIAGPVLAGVSLRVQSKTTEAGLRQTLGSDALPVTFDEIEREDHSGAQRVQGILDLVRQASSETAGIIAKGTQNQTASRVYRIRSCFWFSSINVGIIHQADESRISVLAVHKERLPGPEFERLAADVAETITPAYCAALVARSVRLLPTIRANAETFTRAVERHLGSRRTGEQIGTLLAGAYSLHSQALITDEAALAYVARQEWDVVASGAADTETDERRLLTFLTQARLRINGGLEPTIERLIACAWGDDAMLTPEAAERELRTHGIRTDPGGLWVSNTHPALARLLVGSPWAANWGRSLKRLPGAEASTKGVRFGTMHSAFATFLPRTTLEGGK